MYWRWGLFSQPLGGELRKNGIGDCGLSTSPIAWFAYTPCHAGEAVRGSFEGLFVVSMLFSWLVVANLFGGTSILTKTQRTSRAVGEPRSKPNLEMPKRIFEGATPQERAHKRQALGTLKQLTVQPGTRLRYEKAIDGFLCFLKTNKLTLPTQRDLLDPLVCEYLEHLWSSGAGRALASDTVAGLQDFDPKVRHKLPGSWRLLKNLGCERSPKQGASLAGARRPRYVWMGLFPSALFLCHIPASGILWDATHRRNPQH